MKVVPIPVRSDNYAYLLIDESSNEAAAVDPYDVDKVIQAAQQNSVNIVSVLTTHHHFDHSGGNLEFVSKYPGTPVYGGSAQIPGLTNLIKDGSQITLGTTTSIRCLATPCHTQDSICYYATSTDDPFNPGRVFTGDTLFVAGCGRFFEGTGEEMDRALNYLGTLPDNTIVENGHEYTKSNLAFARSIEPQNPAFDRLQGLIDAHPIATGLTTIGDEKQWNVFMRLHSDAVRRAADATSETPGSDVMQILRDLKNNFKG